MIIKKVEYIDGYKLKLLFNNKKTKIVNLEKIVKNGKGVFLPLKNKDYFKQVSLDDPISPCSICWPNGADICPDVLYNMGKDLK